VENFPIEGSNVADVKNNTEFSLSEYPKEPYICEALPVTFLRNKVIFPLSLKGDTLTLVAENPDDVDTIDAIRMATAFEVRIFKGKKDEIINAIERYYGTEDATVGKIIDDIPMVE
jgi:type IV pilus assembly protein PilB